jgi:drug/metabolite transporter (DMT)-like permease
VQSLLALRFLLAGMLMLTYLVIRRSRMPRGGALGALILMGAVGYVGQSAAYFNSLRFVPAAVTSILLYTYPAIVTVLSWPLYGARLTRLRVAALLLALAGVYLIASPGGGLRWEGLILGLLSAVIYSAYILVGKWALAGVDAWAASTVIALSAGTTYLIFSMFSRSLTLPTTPAGVGAIAGLALVATMIGASSFLAGLSRTDPGRASMISTLEPVSTALLAALLLSERLSGAQLGGGALVLAAVVLIARLGADRR